MTPTRRDLMRGVAAGAVLLSVPACVHADLPGGSRAADDWTPAERVLARISPPTFPARQFDIRQHGALPGDLARTSDAIAAAIDACAAAGGGRVLVPAGEWPTRGIRLKSGVELHVAAGATLKFSTDPDDFLPLVLSRFEGIECMNYAPPIYAFEAENVALTGTGTIDGQASWKNWWNWINREDQAINAGRNEAQRRLATLAEQGVPAQQRIMGEGAYLRPSFVQFYRCRNVLIDGLTVKGSPMWIVHPVLCTNVTVRGLVINSLGPNNDGCNPESCKDVLIERCDFTAGDDCIAIKSGRNHDGRNIGVPSEDIVIRNCRMRDGHGGVSLGSEASGGIRNIYIRDCRMGGSDLLRALRLKSNSWRGGYIENILFRDVEVDSVGEGVLEISLLYGEPGKPRGAKGELLPRRVGGVTMRNVRSRGSLYALDIQSYPELPVDAIRVEDCRFDNVKEGNRLVHAQVTASNVTINGEAWVPA
ncbi:glycoside hydrolase family 28 protein (plasmid) [Croceibacterium sp. TMG7-5b_MA50]|uniref:glycoside hydrolase family 28 protein n=1 Tax=Croceibacterium sp. TMG7-5b_MA50 TaxID=3121290 RepID=UPI003222235D